MVYFLSYLVMTFEEIYKTQKQIFLRGDANLFQSSRGMRVCLIISRVVKAAYMFHYRPNANNQLLETQPQRKKKKKTLISSLFSGHFCNLGNAQSLLALHKKFFLYASTKHFLRSLTTADLSQSSSKTWPCPLRINAAEN